MATLPLGRRQPYVAPEVKVLQRGEAVSRLKQAARGGSAAAKKMLQMAEKARNFK